MFSDNRVLITATVTLETEWVLRSVYRLPPSRIAAAIKLVLGMDNAIVEDATALDRAFSAYEQGMDFADAMHLTQSVNSEAFATFDAALRKRAVRVGGFIPVIAP